MTGNNSPLERLLDWCAVEVESIRLSNTIPSTGEIDDVATLQEIEQVKADIDAVARDFQALADDRRLYFDRMSTASTALREAIDTIRFLSNHLQGRMGSGALTEMELKAEEWEEALSGDDSGGGDKCPIEGPACGTSDNPFGVYDQKCGRCPYRDDTSTAAPGNLPHFDYRKGPEECTEVVRRSTYTC